MYLCEKKTMKKLFILLVCGLMFSACGGSGDKNEATNDTVVSQELQEIQNSASDVNAEAEQLNEKADSLLKNI
jgi:outer membrane lipoprotein-sorting protein